MAPAGRQIEMITHKQEGAMRTYILGAVLLLTAIVAAPAAAQNAAERAEVDRAYATLDQRTRTIVETYLKTDCELGEEGVALKALIQANGRTRGYLTAVQRQGPPSPVLTEFGRGLESTWQAREAYLRTPDAQELGKDAYDRMRAITKDSYLREQQKGIQAKYRERAALALTALTRAGK
jgi:hypothetical protein